MKSYLVLAPIFALACTAQVLNAGSTRDADAGSRLDAAASGTCTEPGGPGIAATTPEECQSLVIGKWSFCGGETASMPTTQFWNGSAGIEFANEGGAIRFYVLDAAAGGALERSSSSAEQGAATFTYVSDGGEYGPDAADETGGACVYTLTLGGAQNPIFWEMFWFESGLLLVEDNSNQIEYRFVLHP